MAVFHEAFGLFSFVCEPTEPCTESKAGGSTSSFVQRSRCVRLVSYRLREVDLFQLVPFLLDFKLNRITVPQVERSVVLVISPLVSLMVDQVSGLQRRGVLAAILSGNTGKFRFLGLSVY